MHTQLQAFELGSHILAVYPNKEKKYEDVFQFLKAGFDANESIVIITDDMTKDDIRKKISKEWKIDNVEGLEAKGDFAIMTSKEGYFPNGKVDIDKIIAQWQSISETAISRGKKAVRVVGDMKGFFNNGFASEVIDYELSLPTKYSLPVIGMCVYEAENINSLTLEQFTELYHHHGIHQLDEYNVLANLHDNNHIMMIYDDNSNAHEAITNYINEGLKRDELCVYASVHNTDEDHIKKISSKIIDYEKNVKDGNLIVLDLARVYIGALCNDLLPYKELAADLAEMARGRKDMHVRIVADSAAFMFQNRHFDECAFLEAWSQKKPFFGSFLCPYPKSMFDKYPFNYHKFRILTNHDLAVDTSGRVIGAYHSNDGTRKQVGQ